MKKGKSKKILLVEDDPDILESVEVTLRMKDYEVATFSQGKGVYDYVRQNRPDLIVMDVMMPPPDGYEVCRQIKSDLETKKIPIILLSARTQKNEIEKGFDAGADRYIPKPFVNEELIRTVGALLKRGAE